MPVGCRTFSPCGRFFVPLFVPPLMPSVVLLPSRAGWLRHRVGRCTMVIYFVRYTCIQSMGVGLGAHGEIFSAFVCPTNRMHARLPDAFVAFYVACRYRERASGSLHNTARKNSQPVLVSPFFFRPYVCARVSAVCREANWLDLESNRHQDYFRRQEKKEKAMYGVGRGHKFNASRQRHDVIERVRMRRELRLQRDRERRPAERNAATDEICSIS